MVHLTTFLLCSVINPSVCIHARRGIRVGTGTQRPWPQRLCRCVGSPDRRVWGTSDVGIHALHTFSDDDDHSPITVGAAQPLPSRLDALGAVALAIRSAITAEHPGWPCREYAP